MSFFGVLELLGGLAIFLYGMSVMGSALEKQSGKRFTRVLERLTANRLRGVTLGAGVTAVIQSSSATTVMVVGLVNAGIMQLSQAINIILGAKIGTTITAWLLSTTGIQGDSFWVQIFKPASFTPVLAFVGLLMIMASKNQKKKDIGTVLIGFALLMYGMEFMSAAVKPLANVPEFAQILLMFSNPILGVLCGMIVTAIIQSSSASVGILQALSMTGAIPYGVAVPIIMGQNIGTCVTAMLASIGTNKNARRAALVHLYSTVISVVLFLALFSLIKSIFVLPILQESTNALGIAIVHSTFNILEVLLWLPFTKQLEKLAYLTIKNTDEASDFQQLDDRFLATPSFAIEQCHVLTDRMAILARDNLIAAMGLLSAYKNETAHQVLQVEDRIDQYEDKLGTYLVKISSKNLTMEDSREVSKLLHCIGDFERIGDHAVNLQQVAEEMNRKEIAFSNDAHDELVTMRKAIEEILQLAIDSFVQDDLSLAMQVEPLEQVVDLLKSKLKSRHIARLRAGDCTTEMGFIFSDLITNYERVADHCSNIAVCIIEIAHDSFETHEYLNEIKHSDNVEFTTRYEEYLQKYALH